jgi:uncharacterized MAPEG superfamily protein
MRPELQALVAAGFLYWGLGQVLAIGKIRSAGLAWGMGNRDTEPETAAWVKRAQKAQSNLLESLPLFTALVLAAFFGQRLSANTELGAAIWIVSRLAHAAIFIAGITFWRTIAYYASLAGLGVMLCALL